MLKREKYLKYIRPLYNNELIKVITGVRRSGKSTIMESIKQELIDMGVSNDDILYINMESSKYYEYSEYKSFVKYVLSQFTNNNSKKYIFIDEIQMIKGFEIAINSLRVDLNSSIFITGSNADLLSGELATYLSGRYVSFKIYPFDYNEFCTYKELDYKNVDNFNEFVKYGGFPLVLDTNNYAGKRTIIDDIYSSIVFKDILSRVNAVRDAQLLSNLLKYIIKESGATFSVKSISDYFKSIGKQTNETTVRYYIDLALNSMIINECKRFDIKGKKILDRIEKYYVVDQGLKLPSRYEDDQDWGRQLENVVFNHCISHGYKVYVGKQNENEIDFKISKHETIKYIQVTYQLSSPEIIEREFRVLENINDNYEKIVVSTDYVDFSRKGIKHINILEFLKKFD